MAESSGDPKSAESLRDGETGKGKFWNPGAVITGVLGGIILGGAGAFFNHGERIARLEERVSIVMERLGGLLEEPGIVVENDRPTPPVEPAQPEDLKDVVAAVQLAYVPESYGESAGQNFSEGDFERFRDDDVPGAITDSLRNDARFLAIVLGLQQADAVVRQDVLREANQPLRQTWSQLGHVTRDGQTEAGNRAERLIADAIVTLAGELLRLSPDSIRRLTVR